MTTNNKQLEAATNYLETPKWFKVFWWAFFFIYPMICVLLYNKGRELASPGVPIAGLTFLLTIVAMFAALGSTWLTRKAVLALNISTLAVICFAGLGLQLVKTIAPSAAISQPSAASSQADTKQPASTPVSRDTFLDENNRLPLSSSAKPVQE